MTREWTCWCVTTRVIDGDTFVADIDLGWGVWHHGVRVRVRDLWCPEPRTDAGQQATYLAWELLIPSSSVVLQIPPLLLVSHALDSFGRTLATITLPDGRDFAGTMIAAGHGTKERP